MDELWVLDHVHWDREWYRPHEEFRARLAELVETVLHDLETGRREAFHLDGQTVTVADVLEIRPDLEPRLRSQVAGGRLTIGPWHVLADNQLVSGETLVRNLLIARRWGQRLGALAQDGYCPDAFGHPADLPRLLRGFGIDTALVWRGAPPEHARFRWRSPDGSEVVAVNQRYHEVEVLWDAVTATEALKAFLEVQRARQPTGPWLLLNGGDHLLPRRLADRPDAAAATAVPVRTCRLPDYFAQVRDAGAGDLPVVDGELRHLGDRLTLLLGGTLSARTYLKQANARAQSALADWVEPLVVRSGYAAGVPVLAHAWDLLVQNSPHDSVCGCSTDAVHRENAVRAERVEELVRHLQLRSLQALGIETRRVAPAPMASTRVAVVNPHAHPVTQGVVASLVTAGPAPSSVVGPDGTGVPFEVEDLGLGPDFEADVDLLPDTATVRRFRLAFIARDVPAHDQLVFEVGLSEPSVGDEPIWEEARSVRHGEATVSVEDDASLSLVDDRGARRGVARLVDGGDRGDSYTWDPPVLDELVSPTVVRSEVSRGPVRTRLRVDARLDLPMGLTEDRDGRAPSRRPVPVRVEVTGWRGLPGLTWSAELDHTVADHRLRLHVPVGESMGEDSPSSWLGDGAWSQVRRQLGPVLGPLPDAPGLEAPVGTAPVQGLAAVGEGLQRTAVFCPGLPEVQGLEPCDGRPAELAVTLLRAVGWLSRFDLRTRTAGAGPQLETPGAQCPGRQRFDLALAWGDAVADDLDLAKAAAEFRVPLRALQVHGHHIIRDALAPSPRVEDALGTAWKPAEDGRGSVLRVSNPTSTTRTARLHVPVGVTVELTDLDERAGEAPALEDGVILVELRPYELVSLRLVTASTNSATSLS